MALFSNFNLFYSVILHSDNIFIKFHEISYEYLENKKGYTISQIMSGRSNVFFIESGEKYFLIDTSTSSNWEKLNSTLKSMGISKIDYLILTHTHHDHAANAKRIKDNYNASVIVHQNEAVHLI